ncbi:hypothetical protein [Pandoraea sputorum]
MSNPIKTDTDWIVALLVAASESARLNRIAATLTGIAVILTTASGVVGLYS